MFGSKKTTTDSTTTTLISTPSVKTTASESSNALNSLVKGTVVEGSITSESDIRVDGTIKGTLTCKAKVIIGTSGFIDGEVRCQNAHIEGKFIGTLRVEELLSIKETAEVVGDVSTSKLLVQPGAIFNVTCNMKDGLTLKSLPSPNGISNGNGALKQPQKELEALGNGAAKK